jgi:hypothetical protein
MYIKPTGKINPEPYWYKKRVKVLNKCKAKQSEQKNFPKPPIV